jgi:DNA invertase Pin-like site-specific DNA recombinase
LKMKPQQHSQMPRVVYAALARVSSEKSEKQGESLANQKAFISNGVKALGGDLTRNIIWDFCDQEHTMSDRASHERKLLKGLMDEVETGQARFQASILQYLDRIGRNKKPFDALIELLQEHDVMLYVGTQPIDLDNEADGLNVGMQKEFSHYWARRSLRASLDGKIAKARKGEYVQGMMYGRYRDRDDRTKWRAAPIMRKKLERAVAQLDRGESFRSVAEKAGLEWTNLYKGLRRAGSVIKCSLGSEAFKKYSRLKGNGFEYEVAVEPLVRDEEMLKPVLARIDANAKRFGMKPRADKDKHRVDFTLKGLVRCGRCNYVMPPHVIKATRVADPERQRRRRYRNVEGKNYYYQHALWHGCYKEYRKEHPKGTKRGAVYKSFAFNVPAERLDVAACAVLFEEMDTQRVLTDALEESRKNNGNEELDLELRLETLRVTEKELRKDKKNLIDVIKSGQTLRTDQDFAREVEALNERLALIEADIGVAERSLRLVRTPGTIQAQAETAVRDVKRGMRESLRMEMEHGLKTQWKALTESDSETGRRLTVKERARKRAELLTNAQRRAILLPLMEEPGCGVFVFKEKDGLHGKIKARNYPEIKFRI